VYLLLRDRGYGHIYIYDCLAPSKAEVTKVYEDLKSRFEVMNEGPIDKYLGVKVERIEI